jgi:two-component system phosphate regulon sensor histidine kinase PhoR
MKRMLPIIIGLISLSLLGILFIQISYLQNVTLLRKDQVKQKVLQVTRGVGEELAQFKGTPD